MNPIFSRNLFRFLLFLMLSASLLFSPLMISSAYAASDFVDQTNIAQNRANDIETATHLALEYSENPEEQGCTPDGGIMWSEGKNEMEVSSQAQQKLGQVGIIATIEAKSYGEVDSCGTYSQRGIDFTITIPQADLSDGSIRQGIIDNILPILTALGKPTLGNVKLVDAQGQVFLVDMYKKKMNTIHTFDIPSDAVFKKVYVIVYDPLLSNGQRLSEYKHWNSYATITQQTIDFFKQTTGNKLNFNVVATTVVDGWPEKTDGFVYTEATYLAVASGQQSAHNPDTANYNKIVNSPAFDLCGKLDRGEIDEVWIYNAPWFGFYESTLVGPNGYNFNSPPVMGSHGCNKLMPIMGPSVERTIDEAIHNFGHRAESIMTQVYGDWQENNTSHNWDKFGLVKAQSPNYSYSGCGSVHYPPNAMTGYEYNNPSSTLSNCDDFANYPTLSDPLQVATPVSCSAWGCTGFGYYGYWFGHFPSYTGCGPDNVANNWWVYFENVALVLYPQNACQPNMHFISGNVGAPSTLLVYMDGVQKTVTSDYYGNYFLMVSNQWSGAVTPAKDGGYSFTPNNISYTNVQSDQYIQNYTYVRDQPDIVITGNNLTILDGDTTPSFNDLTDFDGAEVGSGSVSRTFTIKNIGASNLNLADSPKVVISGANAGDFSVILQPSSPIIPSGIANFTVVFAPSAEGLRSATVSIANNDPEENPYNFSIQGTGDYKEINIKGNNLSIVNNDTTPTSSDHTYFGSVSVPDGLPFSRTFTIYNTGFTDNLNLTGSPQVVITGANASDFWVTVQPITPILPSGSTTFTIAFAPTATGTRNATVSIANDDSNENPYTFSIQGVGIAAPDIEIRGKSILIPDGNFTPSLADDTDFGDAITTGEIISHTFTIYNTGLTGLSLTGNPKVIIVGTNASDFTVTTQPSTPIAIGASTTFTIAFDPSALGLRTASLSISNNDPNENPYNFFIQGNGTPDVTPPSVSISSSATNPVTTSPIAVTVTFSEVVTGFTADDIVVGNGTVSNFSGSGANYTFNLTPSTDGLVTVDIPVGAAQDLAGNNNTAAIQFSRNYDESKPSVSISSSTTDLVIASPIEVTVTFSEAVTGFTVGDIVVGNGMISNFSGSGANYTFNLTPISDGLVTVDILAGAGQDLVGNNNTAATQFSRIYDVVTPSVSMSSSAANPTNASFIAVKVTFNEAVTGFTADDIVVENGTVSNFNGGGAIYTFNLTPITDGLVTADIPAGAAQDLAGNNTNAAIQFLRNYDKTRPSVSMNSSAADPTDASYMVVTVTFSEAVTGFTWSSVAAGNGRVSNVSGSGANYTFYLTPITDGLVTADIPVGAVHDLAGNTNTASAQFSRNYDGTAPSVVSIVCVDPNPTSLSSVNFAVTFSEPVSEVDLSDFTLFTSGVTDASIVSMTGSGATYNVIVSTGSGNGTIRLDVLDSHDILDATGRLLNGGFNSGEVYTVTKIFTVTFTSIANQDGWVRESEENSNQGYTINSLGKALRIGDDANNLQYKTILSFNTASLPDNAIIQSATIRIEKMGVVGSNPFNVLGNLLVDVRKGYFANRPALQRKDFQALASIAHVGVFRRVPYTNWYSSALTAAGRSKINMTGLTQFRLYFKKDDNNNRGADYMKFLSGNAASDQPELIIVYSVPFIAPPSPTVTKTQTPTLVSPTLTPTLTLTPTITRTPTRSCSDC